MTWPSRKWRRCSLILGVLTVWLGALIAFAQTRQIDTSVYEQLWEIAQPWLWGMIFILTGFVIVVGILGQWWYLTRNALLVNLVLVTVWASGFCVGAWLDNGAGIGVVPWIALVAWNMQLATYPHGRGRRRS